MPNKLDAWKNRGWATDEHDLKAANRACDELQKALKKYSKTMSDENGNEYNDIHKPDFHFGFWRGADWGLLRTSISFRKNIVKATGGSKSKNTFTAKEVIKMVREALEEIEQRTLYT